MLLLLLLLAMSLAFALIQLHNPYPESDLTVAAALEERLHIDLFS